MIKNYGSITGERIGDDGTRLITTTIFADTKTEVTDSITGEDVIGVEDDVDFDAGTLALVANGDSAFLNSSHEWEW